jgi:hypothetical protein
MWESGLADLRTMLCGCPPMLEHLIDLSVCDLTEIILAMTTIVPMANNQQ